ncbi:MAG TPA: site-2 protease family protein [Gaiellaceae bacterium]|nr:site-2 protease family protein [Gaiellaceae bacterium]
MDRARLVTDDYQYNPIRTGPDWRTRVKRAVGPVAAAAVALAKWSFVLVKFSSIFIAVAAYALIWGWAFGVGIVVLILLHEMGHYVEAKREHLNPKLPVFIPFALAYVRYTRGNPWQTARVAIAGPIFGGLASLGCYLLARAQGSEVLQALAYFGFFVNLLNMVPIGFLDGGAVWKSARWLRLGGGAAKAQLIYVLYFATAIGLALGMWAAHVTQHRL